FHFPVSADTVFAAELKKRLKTEGLDKKVTILFYLHTNADSLYHEIQSDSFRDYFTHMVNAADGFIAVSQATLDSFLRINYDDGSIAMRSDRSVVIRNGIPRDLYTIGSEAEITNARAAIGLSPNLEKVVSFVGRLDHLKGSDILLYIIQKFERSSDEKDSGVGFVIATPHVLNSAHPPSFFKKLLEMKRLIRENRLKIVLDISKFTRGDPRFADDVTSILTDFAVEQGLRSLQSFQVGGACPYGGMTSVPVQRLSDIYLHPARSEAFGLAVLEAVFSGAHVIASAVGGIPEILSDPRLGKAIPLDPSDVRTFVARAVAQIRAFVGRSTYDRSDLARYFDSYTDTSMFAQFSAAITDIYRKKEAEHE
ncbi:glycosyltransferase family 4 protein, partial [Candidatus Micrarchaeota archaeon]|nr:glycosyltransferase family 4 protein [Candidatus Micrarchaeota archaeon]